MFDYIIVGQGLAGTVLAHTLLDTGKKIFIINDFSKTNSSQAAAGIFNPVTGKRIVKTWKANVLFPFLKVFYQGLETKMGKSFFTEMPIYKPFANVLEQNTMVSNIEFNSGIDTSIPVSAYSNYISNDFGGFQIQNSGYVDVKEFLISSTGFFKENAEVIDSGFYFEDLRVDQNFVQWKNVTAKTIIFCEGSLANKNPYFSWLPFVLTKGEIITVHIDEFPEDVIFNKTIFVMPLGNGKYKCGSTYEWEYETEGTTHEGREILSSRLKELIKKDFIIEHQEAGIRPTVKDRRPLIGIHPGYPTVGIFNGLGTKGVSIAPFFAKQLSDFMHFKKELDPEVNIKRYYTL